METPAGWSLLTLAASLGRESELQFFLERGLDPHHKSNNGLAALAHASIHGHRACAEILAAAMDPARNRDIAQALLCAAEFGTDGCLGILLPRSEAKDALRALEIAKAAQNGTAAKAIEEHLLAQAEKAQLQSASAPPKQRDRPKPL